MDEARQASSSSPDVQPENPAHASSSAAAATDSRAQRAAKAQDKIRRRNRTINSCLECRRRKLKCDKNLPCASCSKFGRDCRYLQGGSENPEAAREIAHLKEQLAGLERNFEERVAGASKEKDSRHSMRSPSLPGLGEDDSSDGAEPLDDEKDLEPTPLAVIDATYYEDADDDLMDLGIRLGKFRITERVGGFVRPKFLEEVASLAAHVEVASAKDGQQLKHYIQETPDKQQSEDTTSPEAIAEKRITSDNDYLGPSTQYLAPSSNFVFGSDSRYTSLDQFLFEKPTTDKLIAQYFDAVHYMCRVVHRPSFERQYEEFWRIRYVNGPGGPKASFVALLMAAMLSAVVSMSEDEIADIAPGQTQANIIDHFRRGTELALGKANFLRTTKLQTLQALVMYLIPLCRAELSRAHSALTGTAIRLAECMGLHRDGTHYGLPPVEIHVRRLVWYQLCFLDLRTCESTGPRPQIRADEFDTKYPLNVDDHDLESTHPPIEDAERWTDATFSRMRFECNEMHRFIWQERPRVEAKKSTLTALLGKVKHFWDATERKYIPMFDNKIPLQCMALLTYRALTYKMNVMVLHRYCSNADRIMPERLRQVMLGTGLAQLEHAIAIETGEITKKWAWYSGAFQQFHTALLCLGELYSSPVKYQQSDRLWACIDYVFELPSKMDPGTKSRLILTELRRRLELYQRHRKVRAPTVMEGRAGLRPVPSIVEKRFGREPNNVLPGGYVLGSAPQPEASSGSLVPGVASSPSSVTAPSSDVQFGTASVKEYKTPPMASAALDTHLFSFVGPPVFGTSKPQGMSFTAQSPQLYQTPGANSDSSGVGSVGTMAAGATMNMDLTGLAEAAMGSQIPGVGPVESRPQGMDMDIDWDEVNRLFPASEWESNDFPLSNMGLDFGQYSGGGMGFE